MSVVPVPTRDPVRVESFDGVRLAAWVQGAGYAPVVMFTHYLGGDAHGWSVQAAALATRFRVIAYDSRGHGASDAPEGPYSIEMLGRDALAVMDHFGASRAHVVGSSQGGMTAMWLGVHHPDRIDRLVLANTTPFIANKPIWDELILKARAEGLDAIASNTIRGWLSEGFKATRPDRAADLVETMRRMPVAGYAGACAVLRDVDLRADLHRIEAPALVVAGAEDGPRGAAASTIASGVQRGRLVTLPGAAHLSHIENAPAFTAALLEHLA